MCLYTSLILVLSLSLKSPLVLCEIFLFSLSSSEPSAHSESAWTSWTSYIIILFLKIIYFILSYIVSVSSFFIFSLLFEMELGEWIYQIISTESASFAYYSQWRKPHVYRVWNW